MLDFFISMNFLICCFGLDSGPAGEKRESDADDQSEKTWKEKRLKRGRSEEKTSQ